MVSGCLRLLKSLESGFNETWHLPDELHVRWVIVIVNADDLTGI